MRAPFTGLQRVRIWHAVLCLLIAVLCVYNPFFTIYGNSGNLHVCHPLSYRGTVASSELRRCTLELAVPLISIAEGQRARGWRQNATLTENSIFPTWRHDDFVPGFRQVVLDGLWFRPPPTL